MAGKTISRIASSRFWARAVCASSTRLRDIRLGRIVRALVRRTPGAPWALMTSR